VLKSDAETITTHTDENGAIIIKLCSGNYVVKANAPGFAITTVDGLSNQ